MADQWHVMWLAEGVSRWNRRRKRIDFAPDLSGLSFYELLPPDFRDSPKTSRYFEKIDLSDADLTNASLSNLNFSNANFSRSNISDADLSKSNFNRADFTSATLKNANLSKSHFNGSIFSETILTNADFEAASLVDVSILGSKITKKQLESMNSADFRTISTLSATTVLRESKPPKISVSGGEKEKREDLRKPKNKYDVFFGTSRQPVFERGALVTFNDDLNQELRYGLCEVIIPDGHRLGSLGSPLWKRLLNLSDDRLRVEALINLNSELFWEYLKESDAKVATLSNPTIFIHGYNVKFEDAVLRAAQIGFDLGIGRGIGLFSWPSNGSIPAYAADEAKSEASKYLLAEFIEEFVKNGHYDKVNLIAHSMGCRCLMGAFELLSKSDSQILKKIDQVILAAADVDANIMPFLGKHAVDNCGRTTAYVSNRDKALKISGWLHRFPRVGVTPPTFVLKGLDTIIVNDLDLGFLSHSYLSSSRTVLSDIYNLLKHRFSPDERHGIEAVLEDGNKFWRIKV